MKINAGEGQHNREHGITKMKVKSRGESEEELLKKAAEHAVNDHGYKEEEIMPPEMQQNIKSHIKSLSCVKER